MEQIYKNILVNCVLGSYCKSVRQFVCIKFIRKMQKFSESMNANSMEKISKEKKKKKKERNERKTVLNRKGGWKKAV